MPKKRKRTLSDEPIERRIYEEVPRHAAAGEASPAGSSPFGQKYEVRGRLRGPAGKDAEVVAVWIILSGDDFPRFVTAFPGVRP